MNGQTDLVAGLIALNSGEVVGKTRLQKIFYLMDRCGIESGFDFEYRDFGPFSVELAREADFAKVAGRIEAIEKPGFHAVPYTVFRTSLSAPKKLGALQAENVKGLLG